MSRKSKSPARTSPRPQKAAPPALPAYIQALAPLPSRAVPRFTLDTLKALEDAFGAPFPQEARRLMVGLAAFDLQGGGVDPLDEAGLRSFNALAADPPDATAWATSRLGLFVVASDAAGNRLCMDVLDASGRAPVWLCTAKMGLAAAAAPVFPCATDMLHALALYTAGAEARRAADDVERITRELEELRKRRPNAAPGRNEALARLQAAFGGGGAAPDASAPSAMDESRMAAALEDARERHKALWMPFMEQFSRWHVYWRLLWNGPNALTFQTEVLDQPLVVAWRDVVPLAGHILSGRPEALRGELLQRAPQGRSALAFAEARMVLGQRDEAQRALATWDVKTLGPLPPRASRALAAGGTGPATPRPPEAAVDWPKVLGLPRGKALRFLHALGAQFQADLRIHGTTNVLGATKAAVRMDAYGKKIVEAGLGHVPLEVRKALFEAKDVHLPNQFLRALTRELTRRLHIPASAVARTLARLQRVVEQHINARMPLVVPHVGTFRVKNEPASTGVSRFYLLLDVVPELLAAAQEHTLHQVSAMPDDGMLLEV